MSLPFNIAIDGFSSSGKSTLAKEIARAYDMQYIDTGAMYRAITYYCIKNEMIDDKGVDINKLNGHSKRVDINYNYNTKTKKSTTIFHLNLLLRSSTPRF